MASLLRHKLPLLLVGVNLVVSIHAYYELSDDNESGEERHGQTAEVVDKQCRRELHELKQSLMPTDLLGWTVFQRRMDGSENFYRNWGNYVNGFGNPSKEFWLGLEKISRLMNKGVYELRVDMQDFEGNWRYAYYKHFHVGTSHDKYPVTTSGYVGNAGNNFQLNNVKFSTNDRDHDTWPNNCAVEFKGAWWYTSCHESNLNGRYLRGKHDSFADGVNWKSFRGYYYSLKFTEMKMRLRASNFE